MRAYLWDSRVADLHHNVADQLKNKEPSIQAAKVKLILHAVVQDLPTANHLLHTHKRVEQACKERNFSVHEAASFLLFSAHLKKIQQTENQRLNLIVFQPLPQIHFLY